MRTLSQLTVIRQMLPCPHCFLLWLTTFRLCQAIRWRERAYYALSPRSYPFGALAVGGEAHVCMRTEPPTLRQHSRGRGLPLASRCTRSRNQYYNIHPWLTTDSWQQTKTQCCKAAKVCDTKGAAGDSTKAIQSVQPFCCPSVYYPTTIIS